MKRKWITGPRLLILVALVVIAAAILLALRRPAFEAEIGTVSRGPLVVTVDDLGETRVTDLYVVSAPVTGELVRVPLKPGDAVTARATLLGRIRPVEPAPLDPRTAAQAEANVRALTAQLAAALARTRAIEAELSLAEREHDRIAALAPRGFVSQARLDQARSARDSTRSALVEARRAADAVRYELAAARAALIVPGTGASGRGAISVTSPVSGFVLRVPQESERVVIAGTPLVEIGDPERLEIVTDLLSEDAVRVQPGAPVLIEDWGGERPLAGRVRRVEPFGFLKVSALGVEEQRVNVVIDFSDPRTAWSRLGHGYRATVRIATWSARDVLRVPVAALFRSGGRWSVFRVDAGGRARLRQVELGAMNQDQAVVRSGLAAGDEIILHPGDRIADGVRIRRREG